MLDRIYFRGFCDRIWPVDNKQTQVIGGVICLIHIRTTNITHISHTGSGGNTLPHGRGVSATGISDIARSSSSRNLERHCVEIIIADGVSGNMYVEQDGRSWVVLL